MRRGKLSWSGIVGALLSTACHQSGHLHPKRNGLRIHFSMTWCFSIGARTAAAISLEASANTAGQEKEDKLPHQQSSRRLLKGRFYNTPSWAAMLPSSLCTVQHIFCNGKPGVTKVYFEPHLHILLHHNGTFK